MLPSSLSCIGSTLDANACVCVVSSFNASYVMVKGFIAHTGTKVRTGCTQIKADALQRLAASASSSSSSSSATTPTAKPPPNTSLNKAEAAELQIAIESVVLTALHKKIFSGLTELYAAEDQRTGGTTSQAARI